ncbi:hypothetical protein BGZ54_006188 [Gamsiella multidivaricata]|nr:hypothetical protein BGZ54_006188 [Gamsiella multidivaricata]
MLRHRTDEDHIYRVREHSLQDWRRSRLGVGTSVSIAASGLVGRALLEFTLIRIQASVRSSAPRKVADDSSLSRAICVVICESIVWVAYVVTV